jgi:nitronate monooxygenase
MTLLNPLSKLLKISYPIIQAGMAGATTPELVAAVSNTGGLGILGAARMTPDQLLDTIRKIKELTTNSYGVNLLLAQPEMRITDEKTFAVQQFLDINFRQNLGLPPKAGQGIILPPSRLAEQLQIILEEKVPLLSFAMGDPVKFVNQIHSTGAKVMSMVTSAEEAVKVARNGTDVIVAQGSEAGGHRSTFNVDPNKDIPLIGTMALVPQVIDALKKEVNNDIPVVAAGGIADGRGLLAALALGASGVLIGTRFLVARESGAFQAYQECLPSSKETETMITRIFTGRPARGLRNRFVDEFLKSGLEPLAWPFQGLAADDIYIHAHSHNNAEYFPLLAGQELRALKKGQTAAEIVKEIMSEARENLTGLNKNV